MKTFSVEKIILIAFAALVAFAVYYGSYLPMRKSQAFISAMREARVKATSFEELKAILSAPLNLPSPVGQEELVRNTANVMLSIINGSSDPELISEIMNFVEEIYAPIIKRGTGTSFGQNLYIMGALNEAAFLKTRDGKYFERAKFYFEKGLELGPKRPQPLYGLFDIYRIGGNVEAAQRIADQILSQWPDDDRIRQGFAEFLEQVEKARGAQ